MSENKTNPKPLDRPDSLSRLITQSRTFPNCSKYFRNFSKKFIDIINYCHIQLKPRL